MTTDRTPTDSRRQCVYDALPQLRRIPRPRVGQCVAVQAHREQKVHVDQPQPRDTPRIRRPHRGRLTAAVFTQNCQRPFVKGTGAAAWRQLHAWPCDAMRDRVTRHSTRGSTREARREAQRARPSVGERVRTRTHILAHPSPPWYRACAHPHAGPRARKPTVMLSARVSPAAPALQRFCSAPSPRPAPKSEPPPRPARADRHQAAVLAFQASPPSRNHTVARGGPGDVTSRAPRACFGTTRRVGGAAARRSSRRVDPRNSLQDESAAAAMPRNSVTTAVATEPTHRMRDRAAFR